jgi:hypothetical protein
MFGASAGGVHVHRPQSFLAESKAANVKASAAARQGSALTEPPLSAASRA